MPKIRCGVHLVSFIIALYISVYAEKVHNTIGKTSVFEEAINYFSKQNPFFKNLHHVKVITI